MEPNFSVPFFMHIIRKQKKERSKTSLLTKVAGEGIEPPAFGL